MIDDGSMTNVAYMTDVKLLTQKYEKVVKIDLSWAIFGKIFGKKSCYRNKPIFGTNTDTENVPESTGKNVPVFPVHFHKNVPDFENLTVMHGLTLSNNVSQDFFNTHTKIKTYKIN